MDAVRATRAIDALLRFAIEKRLIAPEDKLYAQNLLLDIMKMDAPAECELKPADVPETATAILNELDECAVEAELIPDSQGYRDLLNTRLMGAVTPSPYEVRAVFDWLRTTQGSEAATRWFYQMCRASDYIRVDHIAKNVRFFAPSPAGELEITINLSKPEKDPRDIIAQRNAPQVGYPKCMLCEENPGYAGRLNFPGRQNHRMVPLILDGEKWFLQYSPYLYYPEHCIVLNSVHTPMKHTPATYRRLFDFVDQFPHFFLGANADLPIVGGSILSHDHFQGGHYSFPMDKAKPLIALNAPDVRLNACVIDWPMSCVRLTSGNRDLLTKAAVDMLEAWHDYSDPELGILAQTDAPHNAITPVLRKQDGLYRLDLVLRNNRTSPEHPLGIFHPHAQLHHIKKENIGLIEVMGLFILPGRLLSELDALSGYLTGEKDIARRPEQDSPLFKHFDWIVELAQKHGTHLDAQQAQAALRAGLADKCAQVLSDAGVYKQNEAGRAGILRFLSTLGYTEKNR